MITIDLTNPSRAQEILLTNYLQKLPLKRSFLGFNKTSRWKLNIKITNLDTGELIIGKPENLIQLKINGQEGSDLTLDVSSQELYFDSFINTGEIKDCSDTENIDNQNKIYKIKYQIEYSIVSQKNAASRKIVDEKGVEKTFEHDICFSKINQQAVIGFKEPEVPVEYKATGNNIITCGVLDLCLAHLYIRAPFLNMKFSLSVIQNTPHGEISRADIVQINKLDISESSPYAPEGSMKLWPEGIPYSVLEFDYDPINKQYSIGRFFVNENHHIFLPVTFDLSRINNPRNSTEVYTLVIKGQTWNRDDIGNKTNFRKEFPITISRNSHQTDLEVQISIPTAKAEPEIYRMIPEKDYPKPVFTAQEILVNGGTRRDFNLIIRNSAEAESNPDAAVRVKNFQLSSPIFPDGVKAICADNYSPFEIINEGLLDSPNELFNLRFGEKDTTLIRYRKDSISGFTVNGETCFETNVRFDFSFQYIVDTDGSKKNPAEGDFERFAGSIVLPMSVAPAAEWMCIDFGTSAVVAEYGKSIYNEQGNVSNNLVNLREKKTELLQKTFGDKEKGKRVDRNETNTEFISSMSSFNDFGDLNAYKNVPSEKEYKNATIWFSPSTSMIDPSYQLPCLKSLMGYETLPKGIFPSNFEIELSNHPVSKVNTIYEIIYRQFFTYYINHIPHGSKGIEKLVLSIPNTFAPIHLKMLRKIAIDCIPTLRHSRIRFVSESDAVAYYYLSRRNNIMRSGEIPLKNRKDIDENTLVYDMGAGTLDLTYFSKKETTQTTEIEIKGKMGVNKAGNYIDYLIAEILADLLLKTSGNKFGERISQMLVLDRDKRNSSVTNQNCNELKSYIRDQIKPALNNPERKLERCTLDTDNELADFTGNDILKHPKFQKFLYEITDGVFTSFANLFGNDYKMPIDLVIFSGRSTSLQIIRDVIMNSISRYNTKSECHFVDIAAERFVQINEQIDQRVVNGLKSVVAAGALAYPTIIVKDEIEENRAYRVKNRNVYATYGIMVHTPNGWQWYPMIDSKTRPTTTPKSIHGMDISCYDSSRYNVYGESKPLRLPLGNIDSLYVLQSYSVDTKRDWEDNDKEMITVLCCKTLANYNQVEDVALKITEDNEIVLWIGAAPTEMYSHDDFYNTSFRKSMWPVIFSESKNQA